MRTENLKVFKCQGLHFVISREYFLVSASYSYIHFILRSFHLFLNCYQNKGTMLLYCTFQYCTLMYSKCTLV